MIPVQALINAVECFLKVYETVGLL